MSRGPRAVAIGGGHGTAATLRALRGFAGDITAIVSVADDGGSSGRLRELLGIPALGDLRKCLVALSDPESDLAEAMEHRFSEGEMSGHALGNMLLAGLIETEGGLVRGIEAAARLLGVDGRVLPATLEPVALIADRADGTTLGQVEISRSGPVATLRLDPPDAEAPEEAVRAILEADLVVIGPGSLFTSVIAAILPRRITDALAGTRASRVYVCNLRPQDPETAGFSVADHLDALRRHGAAFDEVLWDQSAGMVLGDPRFPVRAELLAGSNRLVHDPGLLAVRLAELVG